MSQPLYAGIDVSKDWCDVALEAGDASAGSIRQPKAERISSDG